jgi:hypothetical protein
MKDTQRKGRRLTVQVKDKILKTFKHLRPDDVVVAAAGQQGEDIKLSKTAKRLFPYQVECKAQERLKQLFKFWKQTKGHGNKQPLLIVKMNGTEPLAILDLDHFFELVE